MATTREQFIVDAKGKKTGVVLSLRRYQRLMEDLHDLAVVAERRTEKARAAFGSRRSRANPDGSDR